MARALEALDTLDLTVPNHLANDAAMLAVWKRERRLSKPKAKKAADLAAPEATPQAA